MGYIRSIAPLENYHLFLEMTTGSIAIIDISKRFHSIRFAALQDKKLFQTAVTNGNYVIWGDGLIKVDVKELLDILLIDRSKFS